MPHNKPPIIRLKTTYLDLAVRDLGFPRFSHPRGGTRVRESIPERNSLGETARSLVREMMESALEGAALGRAPLPDELKDSLDPALIRDLEKVTGKSREEILDFLSGEIPKLINLHRLSGLMDSLEERGSLPVSPASALEGKVERPIIAAESGAFRDLLDDLEPVAENPYSVLITGPTGSGKELIARRIHALSPFSRGPFVPVDCAGIPEGLVEAELFGHRKGAFTGALRARPGKLELAAGGTLFLDEVAELPVNSQVKLLRFLQERVVERLGGGNPVELKLKVVAATSRDLDGMMETGLFRADLYYRLATIPLSVPPLKERPQDIPLLIDHYLARAKMETGLARGLSKEVRALLAGYHYPGNVRELINMINQLVALSKKHIIDLDDLPVQVSKSLGGFDAGNGSRLKNLALAGIRPENRPALARLLAESQGGHIFNADLRKVLGCSDSTAKKTLKRLADVGLLAPKGARGGRRYLVKTELEEN